MLHSVANVDEQNAIQSKAFLFKVMITKLPKIYKKNLNSHRLPQERAASRSWSVRASRGRSAADFCFFPFLSHTVQNNWSTSQ